MVEKISDRSQRMITLSEKARQIRQVIEHPGTDRYAMELGKKVDDVSIRVQEEFPESTIRTEIPDDVTVWVSPYFEQAIENIIDNGIRHNTHADPRVEVSTRTLDRSTIEITVADNGPPIPVGERELHTEGKQENPLEHSSGLGLWLATLLVERSGGEIDIHTGAQGNTVRITVQTRSETGELT